MVAKKANPEYDLSALIRACSIPGAVIITKNARNDARDHFNLETASRVLGLIANNGLEDLQYENTNPLEKGIQEDIGKNVDGYNFRIGPKCGYIAFYVNFKRTWIIKSFHPPKFGERAESLTQNPFQKLENLKK